MKLSAQTKRTLPGNLPGHCVEPYDSVQGGETFLCDVLRKADVSAKEFQFQMRVSKTTQQKWYRGELPDPIERARQACAIIAKRNPHLIGLVLLYIAGDGFDGLILDPAKKAAVEEIAKAVKP